jgi:nucleoside-diphosphate-sugar epimerase
VINVGSNYEISILDTARTIADVMGKQVEFLEDSERLRPAGSEVERLWASADKARKLCGWEPAYGGLDGLRRGLDETAHWFLDPQNLAQYKADQYNI